MPRLPKRLLVLVALAGASACTPSVTASAPVFDGFDYQPKRVINAGESYTFTANAHVDGGMVFTEWQADAGELSVQDGTSTSWIAVKPGDQVKSGRVRVEVRVVAVGGSAGAKGGTAFLTVDDQGRANLDGFLADVYSDTPGATPTPGLTPPPAAAPLPMTSPPNPTASAATGAAIVDSNATH